MLKRTASQADFDLLNCIHPTSDINSATLRSSWQRHNMYKYLTLPTLFTSEGAILDDTVYMYIMDYHYVAHVASLTKQLAI